MLRPAPKAQAYLYMQPVDMRKSIDGLAALVENELELSPMSEVLFVFCNRARDKIKMLYWERSGFVVWYKRLEQQRFQWPREAAFSHTQHTGYSLNALLDGYNIWPQQPHKTLPITQVQ